MCEIDLEPCDVFTGTKRKTRKLRMCSSCGARVAAGDVYSRFFMVLHGHASSEPMCAGCRDDMGVFGAAPGHSRCAPSYFPELLRSCVDDGDADSTWVAMLDRLHRRGTA